MTKVNVIKEEEASTEEIPSSEQPTGKSMECVHIFNVRMPILILVVQPLSVWHQETKGSVRKVAQHDSRQQVRKHPSSMDSA